MTDFTRRQVLAALGTGLLAPHVHAARMPRITAVELTAGLSLFDGAGCNVVALRGPTGSLLIDGGQAANSQALLKAVAGATGNARIATLINTHWHPAQTGSNETVGRSGGEIIAHERTAKYLARAVESVDYDGLYGPLPAAARPTNTTRDKGSLEFAGQHIEYGYLPAAHTDGDLYVHFPEANVLVAGGPVCAQRWPMLDYRNGGWLGGLVRAHETLALLVSPDTRIVPADGRVLTGRDLARHRDMYRQLHEQLFVYINKGYGPSDAIAQRPLKDHEAELGDSTEFVKGAYRSLFLAYLPD